MQRTRQVIGQFRSQGRATIPAPNPSGSMSGSLAGNGASYRELDPCSFGTPAHMLVPGSCLGEQETLGILPVFWQDEIE
jgi:hypothetical protein